MANQWFRMYGEFATDPKVQMLSEANQRRYIMLLCLRCSNGDVTLHDDEIAFQLRISSEEWAATKAVLLGKKLITEDSRPTAWDKRQYLSDSSAARVAAHRAKKKADKKRACNVTETPPDTDTDTEVKAPLTPAGEDAAPVEPEQEPAQAARAEPAAPVAGLFPMHLEWVPDQVQLKARAAMAGLALDLFDREAIAGFVIHHEAKGLAKTEREWLAALVNWVKRDAAQAAARPAAVVSFPGGQRRANGPDFHDTSWRTMTEYDL